MHGQMNFKYALDRFEQVACHSSRFTAGGKTLGFLCVGAWVGPSFGLEVLEKR
jgi:hypothetical protein